jgi:GT2 family glycosyltransferase
LNRPYPPFWSTRFGYILALALRGDFFGGLTGLYWFVTRRRVRGWGKLLVAASLAQQAYGRWVRVSEPGLLERFRTDHPDRSTETIGIVLVAQEGVSTPEIEQTIESIRNAFGSDVPIVSTIATNSGPPLAQDWENAADALNYDWLFPIVAGDRVHRAAGEVLRRAIFAAKGANLLYWDEDALETGRRVDPWIKPEFDELLFSAVGGLAGASLVSTAAVPSGAIRLSCLAGRGALEAFLLELATGTGAQVAHLPLVLTHRSSVTRLPSKLASAEPSVLRSAMPTVSIIIPTRDRADLLRRCVRGIAQTSYQGRLEVIIVDNGTVDEAALAIIAEQRSRGAIVLRDDGAFNFARLNNRAAEAASGDFLCFYNNDVEPLDPSWLERLMAFAVAENTGAVGALLLYPSGRIQHAGVAVGLGGAAGHVQKGVRPDDLRFRTWHAATREVSAVTAAVMVVRKSHFDAAGGFDEAIFPIAFNDVDLCLRLKGAGLRNVFVAEARLLHRESESRGDDRRHGRAEDFALELAALQQRWSTESFEDPHFSPLFVRSTERCVLVP